MKKIKDILKLKYITELSYRQISRGINVPSSTISDYCKRFEKTKSLELMESIVNAKSNVVELKSALIDKDEKIQRLEKELKLKKEMTFEAPVYWHIENNVKDGPFCQKCYDVDKNLVRLQVFDVSHEGAWNCSACGGHYRTKEYSEWFNQQLA